ncbi:MAG: methylmalonyl Co-A mutase-associated GTPase MeaB [Bacteroidia bacterium]|nr:methylmalonyl Co-A mutase-associated GTPase MeaB [Bacteroidia bacterium]MDW8157904.1 methylmalonyl Co-A mutase-associated GTPase MeaB [Bacteroidia bacterium]
MFRKRKSVEEYKQLLRAQHVPTLSEVITLAESTRVEDKKLFQSLLSELLPFTGNSFRLGISGPPGVGKSTLIENFGPVILRHFQKLAILAIDPSSQKSKGSILGDKTRMEKLSQNPSVFIRPTAAGNTLGGVARATREAILICEATGFDFIIVESVGVGQSEAELHQMTDFFLLLQLPGSGDELQGIKRGIMELADGIAITKAEGNNKPLAKKIAKDLQFALHLLTPSTNGWIPKVILVSSFSQEGLEELMQMLLDYQNWAYTTHWFEKKRKQQQVDWFHRSIQSFLLDFFYHTPECKEKVKELENKVLQQQISPSLAADQVIQTFFEKIKTHY